VPSIWDRAAGRQRILGIAAEDAGEALFSYGYVRNLSPEKLRNRFKIGDHTRIWIDSSGFQIGNKVLSKANVFDVFEFQRRTSSVAITLDMPGDVEQTYRNALLMLTLCHAYEESPELYAVVTQNRDCETASILAKKYEHSDFHGLAVGALIPYGVSNLEELARLLFLIRKQTTKPIHALGVGGYDAMYLLSAFGVSSFDSAKFIVGAKWRVYHLPRGGCIYVGNRYKDRQRTASSGLLPCSCPVCSEVKTAEYFQQPKAVCVAMLAMHNYFMMRNEVRLISLAKKEGWFDRLLSEKARQSTRLHMALKSVGKLNRIAKTNGQSEPN
jgi:7-cyano-7-deazaguanine tRNA-ribosyltransferase